MNTRIALCQLNPKAGKPEENFATIEQTIKSHADQKVKLFIFPEDFLNGILRNREDILSAGKKFAYWTNRFCGLAKKHNVDLIPGSFSRLNNNKLYNTTTYINSKGKVLNIYSKTNLWLSERNEYSPNDRPPKSFKSTLGKTVQIICWDLMDHRLFKEALKQDVKWIINTSLWSVNQTKDLERKRGKTKNTYNLSLRKSERLDSIIESRCHEYNMGMIFCNISGVHKCTASDGSEEIKKSAGSTQVISPLDGVRRITKNRREQVLICDIPEIKEYISDHEILWGRREDIKTNYPYSQQGIYNSLASEGDAF